MHQRRNTPIVKRRYVTDNRFHCQKLPCPRPNGEQAVSRDGKRLQIGGEVVWSLCGKQNSPMFGSCFGSAEYPSRIRRVFPVGSGPKVTSTQRFQNKSQTWASFAGKRHRHTSAMQKRAPANADALCALGGEARIRTGGEGFAGPCLTTWPLRRYEKGRSRPALVLAWSGLRGSNPRPPPWQGGALPTALSPRAQGVIYGNSAARASKKWTSLQKSSFAQVDAIEIINGQQRC